MPWASLIHVYIVKLSFCIVPTEDGGTGAHFTDRAHGSDFSCSWCCCPGMHCGIWSPSAALYPSLRCAVSPPVPRHCGVLRVNGQQWENRHCCCSGWDFPEKGKTIILVQQLLWDPCGTQPAASSLLSRTGLWEHPEPGAAGRERGEAERGVHGVLPGGLLHQEAGSRAGGESPWNRNCFTLPVLPVWRNSLQGAGLCSHSPNFPARLK